jgi:hypothetical protein
MMTRRSCLAAALVAPTVVRRPDPKHEAIRRAVRKLESLRSEWREADTILDGMLDRHGVNDGTHAHELDVMMPLEARLMAAYKTLMVAMGECGARSGALICGGRVYVGDHASIGDDPVERIVFDSAKLLNLDGA